MNQHLNHSKQKKDNEYYTLLPYIENFFFNTVLKQNPSIFKNKIVLLFADEPKSNFNYFFKTNFSQLGLKAIVRTHYQPVNLDLTPTTSTSAEITTKKGSD